MKRLTELMTQESLHTYGGCAQVREAQRRSKSKRYSGGLRRLWWLFSRTALCGSIVSVSYSVRKQ